MCHALRQCRFRLRPPRGRRSSASSRETDSDLTQNSRSGTAVDGLRDLLRRQRSPTSGHCTAREPILPVCAASMKSLLHRSFQGMLPMADVPTLPTRHKCATGKARTSQLNCPAHSIPQPTPITNTLHRDPPHRRRRYLVDNLRAAAGAAAPAAMFFSLWSVVH